MGQDQKINFELFIFERLIRYPSRDVDKGVGCKPRRKCGPEFTFGSCQRYRGVFNVMRLDEIMKGINVGRQGRGLKTEF